MIASIGIVLAIAGYLFLTREPPPDPALQPAFGPGKLAKLKPNWFEQAIDDYGLRQVRDAQATLKDNYVSNVGTPFRFKAYIPATGESQERAGLSVSKYGYQFVPAIFLPPTKPQTEESLTDAVNELTEGLPIQLAFPASEVRAPGTSYEISGLLWWNADGVQSPSAEELEYPISPTILVADARPLSVPELTQPTTHRADLDVIIEESDLRLTVRRLEWSAGAGARACVELSNVSNRRPKIWLGQTDSTLEFEGSQSFLGMPEPGTALEAQAEIERGQTVTGYLLYDGFVPPSGPTGDVVLRFPSLAENNIDPISGVAEEITITVTAEQFEEVTEGEIEGSTRPLAGCSGT